jgi:CheY-like chemotaxis protein
MNKHILIFEDDRLYVESLVFRMADFVSKTGIDLRFTHELCADYCEATLKLDEIEQTKTVDHYDLIIIDLKLPFASARPEQNEDVQFRGLALTRLIRQKFSDKIQYLPITSLLNAVKNLDPELHDVDQLDIDRAIDKRIVPMLAEEVVKRLTAKRS